MIITKQQFIPATILAFLVPASILLYDYKYSEDLSVYAEVSPSAEWTLVKGRNDQIASSLMDYKTGVITDLKIIQFDRGETISLNFAQSFEKNKSVSAGDTIAKTVSSNLDEQILNLENDIAIAKASLNAGMTGEKDAVIKELIQSKAANSTKLSLQKKILDRDQALYEKHLISDTDFEKTQQEFRQIEFNDKILEAKIESGTSGDKPSIISLLQTKLKSYERSLEILKRRKSEMILVCPISGIVIPSFSSDTLLSIMDLKKIVLKVPMKLSDALLVHERDLISVSFRIPNIQVKGLVTSLAQRVTMFNGEPVRIVTLEIDNQEFLLPGMVTQVTLIPKSE